MKIITAESFVEEFFNEVSNKSISHSQELMQKRFKMIEMFNYLKECNGIRELLILRGHLCVEYFLNKAIDKFIPNNGKLTEENNFSFSKKLIIVDCFNVFDLDTKKFINELNILRNKCAHKINYKISEKTIYELGKLLPEDISQKTYEKNLKRKTYHYELLLNSIACVLVDMEFCLESHSDK